MSRFNLTDVESARNYLRFVVVNAAFGGLTVKKTARELLFGYSDPLLVTLKEMDPAMGGDPSIDPVIHFNELNSTREQASLYPM